MTDTELRAARPLQALLLSASALAIATPATAAQVVFSTGGDITVETGERRSQAAGLTQVRLDNGAMLSFVDTADYRINADGSVDLYAGSVTVAGAEGSETTIRMPEGVEGRVGGGAAASFSVAEDGGSRGHALTGSVAIVRAGNARTFEAGAMWAASGDRLRRVVSNGAQNAPGESEEVQVADMEQGGPVAAAVNGLPVSLGDALAAAGASGDVLAAARRVEAASSNPDIATFPTGDLALLVSYAVQLQNAYGAEAFPGAQPDIIRAYLGYLSAGGSGENFLATYTGILTQYLDLLRAGALPSSFQGANLADIDAFLRYTGRTSDFAGFTAQNRALIDAYLSFLASGGDRDLFVRSYTDLIHAYFAFLRAGGDPAAFQGATQQTISAYIAFLSQSGLAAHLSAADRALLEAYLAHGGLAFASQYRAALDTYFSFLARGNLPSRYTGLDAATLRSYLEALQSAGLLAQVLGAQADFYAAYLAHLQAGGALDTFAGLNANIFAGYAQQLDAYYEYLLRGGQPSVYTALTQQQIAAYLAALERAGASRAFLAELAEFYTGYLAHLTGGGDPDVYTGLPVLNLPAFAEALNAYAAFLAEGGLPSGYSASQLATLAQYLNALSRSGQLAALLGANAELLNDYFAHLAAGGSIDAFAGLPIYTHYVSALQAYYAFLDAGGLPADYSVVTQEQVRAYLAALAAAGGFNAQLGSLSDFFTAYYAFVAAGGDPANFAGLPVYADYLAAIEAYYAFLAGGGRPSAYTLLTQAQIRAYLQALAGAGVLARELSGDQLDFVLGYLAYLQTGGDPDDFAELPVNNQPATLLAGANAWIFSNEGGQSAVATSAEVEDDGQIVSAALQLSAGSPVAFDYSGAANTLREHGRAGDNVAWTRYERGAATGVSNQNVHLLLGSPATELPAEGTIDYRLIGGTAPTDALAPAGEIGAFTGDLAVAFGTSPRVGLNFDVHVGTRGWRVQTPGGASGAATGGLLVGSTMQFQNQDLQKSGIAGNACAGYCNASVFGGLFGSGAANVGFQYHINDQSSGGRSYVNGTAVFGTSGTELSGIGTMPASGTVYAGPFDAENPYIDLALAGRVGANPLAGGEFGFLASDHALNAAGTLTSVTRSGGVTRSPGSATVSQTFANADALIQRWSGGTTGGSGANPFIVGANQGVHILLTRPITSAFEMPAAGRIDYYVQSATSPTIADGSLAPGTFEADLALLFGSSIKVAMEGQITMPRSGGDLVYDFGTTGGIDDAAASTTNLTINSGTGRFSFSMPGTDGSAGCVDNPSCTMVVYGGFTGSDTDTLGMAYTANRATNATSIAGVAVFGAGEARSGGAGGSTPPTIATGDYTDQYLLNLTYASFDAQYSSTVTYDSGGMIVAWTRDNGSTRPIGQAGPSAESGSIDGIVGWSRWLDLNNFESSDPKLPNTGNHLLSGTPATDLPGSGKIDYALTGQTKPTDRAGNLEPGTFTGTMAVDFASRKVGFDFDVAIGDHGWNMKSAGGSADPNTGGYNITASNGFSGNPIVTGTAPDSCTTTCSGNVRGMLFGTGASHAGAGYSIIDSGAGVVVTGVAAFARP